jgi:dolichol-phosphate mannosyltransferase
MIHYSVVVPLRDRGEEFRRQMPRLIAAFHRLRFEYEIICVDDGSAAATHELLLQLQRQQPAMRLLRMDEPAGASVALSVGMSAARGDIVIAIEADHQDAAEQIPHLIARLSRLDLVYAKKRLTGWGKFWHRIGRIPRAILLGLEVRHPENSMWAARREAVAGIHLTPGMRRYLPWMVARRGFRVGDMYVDASRHGERSLGGTIAPDGGPHPMDLLTAWWLCRRWRNDSYCEIGEHELATAVPGPQIYRAKSA